MRSERLDRFDEAIADLYAKETLSAEQDAQAQALAVERDALLMRLMEEIYPDFFAQLQQQEILMSRSSALTMARINQRNRLQSLKEALEKELPADVVNNWKEAQADSFGFEIYLKAGFPKEAFMSMLIRLNTGKTLTNQEFLRDYCEQDPRRGIDSHPSNCWRVQLIEEELFRHREAYRPYLENTSPTHWPDGILEEIQMIIKES